jgi:hypothetical protein
MSFSLDGYETWSVKLRMLREKGDEEIVWAQGGGSNRKLHKATG